MVLSTKRSTDEDDGHFITKARNVGLTVVKPMQSKDHKSAGTDPKVRQIAGIIAS
jgi:hypothetical protein